MAEEKRKSERFEAVKLSAAEPGWFVRITLPHGEQIHINERGSRNIEAADMSETPNAAAILPNSRRPFRTIGRNDRQAIVCLWLLASRRVIW